MHPNCPRCGVVMQTTDKRCGLCRMPANAPEGWALPEHDDKRFTHPVWPAGLEPRS